MKNKLCLLITSFFMGLGISSEALSEEQPVVTSKDTKVTFYGFLRLDANYNDSRSNDAKTIGWILSEDPSAVAGTGATKNKEQLTMHPRLTRFGFKFDGGKIEDFHNSDLTGVLEMDFYGNITSESRSHIRMRKAYVKFGWDDASVLVGQNSDLISPLYPVINSDLVMWGAGNLGDRRMQIRGDYWINEFVLQGMVGLTGADDNADIDSAASFGSGVNDGETSAKPTLQARMAYESDAFKLGVWAHRAWEEPDTTFILNGDSEFDSHAVGIDYLIPLGSDFLLSGEAWTGSNLDDVRGGIFQGLNTAHVVIPNMTQVREIDAKGGWSELMWKRNATHSISAGFSMDDPDNKDLNAGGRTLNQISYLANRWNYSSVTLGLDYMYWTTRYLGQGSGNANRLNAFVQYKF